MMYVGADKSWCEMVAGLGVDELVQCGLEDFEKATEIVAEEILIRLSMGDYPPVPESDK